MSITSVFIEQSDINCFCNLLVITLKNAEAIIDGLFRHTVTCLLVCFDIIIGIKDRYTKDNTEFS